jgi:hypothetical protein
LPALLLALVQVVVLCLNLALWFVILVLRLLVSLADRNYLAALAEQPVLEEYVSCRQYLLPHLPIVLTL